eukprot:5138117-Amphidinium_carterae.1
MQDIVQRGEMTITKIQTTHNPADPVSNAQSVGSLHGLPTSRKLTIGMIGLASTDHNEVQPATLATESRAMRQSQAQQMRRRRSTHTPPRNVQQREIVARDNAVELAFAQRPMTITQG